MCAQAPELLSRPQHSRCALATARTLSTDPAAKSVSYGRDHWEGWAGALGMRGPREARVRHMSLGALSQGQSLSGPQCPSSSVTQGGPQHPQAPCTAGKSRL